MKFIPPSLVLGAALVLPGMAVAAARPTLSQPKSPVDQVSQVQIPVPTLEESPPILPPAPASPAPAPVPASPAPAPVPASPAPAPVPASPAPEPRITPAAESGTSSDFYFLARAKNLARQAAIQENGGLTLYRPESSMFGPALKAPFQQNQDGSVTFRFQGGTPGAAVLDRETEVLVDSSAGVTIVYNGPVRGAIGGIEPQEQNSSTLAILNESSFLARARNLARQAGIAANGGLGAYRPEASMFGPTSNAPFEKNQDGSVTFTFKGGAPLTQVPSQETAVTVTREGTVTVDYNRPI